MEIENCSIEICKDMTIELDPSNCGDVWGYSSYQTDERSLEKGELAEQEILDFTISPNPTRGEFTLSNELPGTLQIIDLSGNLINTQSLVVANQVVSLDLQTGLYIVKFVDHEGNKYNVQRLMIQK